MPAGITNAEDQGFSIVLGLGEFPAIGWWCLPEKSDQKTPLRLRCSAAERHGSAAAAAL
jgi:hypothetical protein